MSVLSINAIPVILKPPAICIRLWSVKSWFRNILREWPLSPYTHGYLHTQSPSQIRPRCGDCKLHGNNDSLVHKPLLPQLQVCRCLWWGPAPFDHHRVTGNPQKMSFLRDFGWAIRDWRGHGVSLLEELSDADTLQGLQTSRRSVRIHRAQTPWVTNPG